MRSFCGRSVVWRWRHRVRKCSPSCCCARRFDRHSRRARPRASGGSCGSTCSHRPTETDHHDPSASYGQQAPAVIAATRSCRHRSMTRSPRPSSSATATVAPPALLSRRCAAVVQLRNFRLAPETVVASLCCSSNL